MSVRACARCSSFTHWEENFYTQRIRGSDSNSSCRRCQHPKAPCCTAVVGPNKIHVPIRLSPFGCFPVTLGTNKAVLVHLEGRPAPPCYRPLPHTNTPTQHRLIYLFFLFFLLQLFSHLVYRT